MITSSFENYFTTFLLLCQQYWNNKFKFLKIIKESVKNENYASLKAYFDDERTERALRELTEC